MGHLGLLALLIASAVHCVQSQQNSPAEDLQVDQAGQGPWIDEAALAAWGQGGVIQGSGLRGSGVEPIPDYGADGSLLAVDQPAIPTYQQL